MFWHQCMNWVLARDAVKNVWNKPAGADFWFTVTVLSICVQSQGLQWQKCHTVWSSSVVEFPHTKISPHHRHVVYSFKQICLQRKEIIWSNIVHANSYLTKQRLLCLAFFGGTVQRSEQINVHGACSNYEFDDMQDVVGGMLVEEENAQCSWSHTDRHICIWSSTTIPFPHHYARFLVA